jgi:hypothetical protein
MHGLCLSNLCCPSQKATRQEMPHADAEIEVAIQFEPRVRVDFLGNMCARSSRYIAHDRATREVVIRSL